MSVHACEKVFCSHPPVDCLGIESCRQAKNNSLNKRKRILSESLLVLWFKCATGFDVLMISSIKMFTVQSRLKIANNPNFDSTAIRCSAATARMKTNMLRDRMSIQFEGEPSRSTPRVDKILAENFTFFVVLDGLTYFFVRYFQHLVCIVDDKRASLHENQIAVFSYLLRLLCLNQFSSSFAIVSFLQE